MVNFPTPITDCLSAALLDLFISSDASVCSTMTFRPLGNSDYAIVAVSIEFLSNPKQDAAPLHCMVIGMVFATASELCEWVHVGIDVYISNRKYQVKPHTSPWSSAACAVAIVHRYLFFFFSFLPT